MAKKSTSSLWPPIFTLIGTTIGAGVLAMPYTFVKSGYLVGLGHLFLVLCLTFVLNLAYAEILVQIKGKHQLAGYAGIFFGQRGKWLASIALLIGGYGALLAYTIQAGIFLHTLVPSVAAAHFSMLFYVIVSSAVFMSLRWFSLIEVVMVVGLLILLGIITILGIPHIQIANYQTISTQLEYLLLPYGVLLFAFSGYSVIPELGMLTKYDAKNLRKVIIAGTLLVAVVYMIFSAVVVGVSGSMTSQDAITGLLAFLESHVVKVGIVIAVIAISTSFISLGHVMRDLYEHDLNVRSPIGWFLAIYPPLLIFILGDIGFVQVLEFSGAVTVGLSGVLLGVMYLKVVSEDKKAKVAKFSPMVIVSSLVIFVMGIFYEIFRGFF